MPALELSRLHGHGASSGGDAFSDACGADGSGLPSWAPTDASGMPGDLDDGAADTKLVVKPNWDDGRADCSAGVWMVGPRGGGEDVKGEGGKGSRHDEACGTGRGPAGTFGLLTANWGGNWADPKLQEHMREDLKSSSCQLLVIQEASYDLLDYVQVSPREGEVDAKDGQRPPAKWIAVRGTEDGDSTMICGRASLVTGMRILVFHRSADGTYTHTKQNKKKEKVTKTAVSRIMIASAQMRFWKSRGSGEAPSADQGFEELRIANVHLHAKTAKKSLQSGGECYKRFWDLLARYLAEFRPPFSAGTSTWRSSLLCRNCGRAAFRSIWLHGILGSSSTKGLSERTRVASSA